MNVTLRQLRYFQALARERHFGRAADSVAVTQPALSAQIREFEAALGGPVVERKAPGLPLTPLGRAALRRADSILAESRALEAEARNATGLAAGIRLGMIPTVAPYLVPPLLPLIRAGGGRLSIREAVTDTLLTELRQGEIDAAVLALPAGVPRLIEEPLFEDRFLLARPPRALAPRMARPERPEQIDPDILLLLDEGHCLSDQALGACKLRRDGARIRLGAASLATLTRLVASGHGVTLIPEIAADVEGRGVRLSRFTRPEPGRVIGLVRLGGAGAAGWPAMLAECLREAVGRVPRREP